MITICRSCGNYTVRQGEELAGARTMVKRLRDDLSHPDKRQSVIDQHQAISQLMLEVELLTAATFPKLSLVSA